MFLKTYFANLQKDLYIKLLILSIFITTSLIAKTIPTCIYISSYHQGFSWSDGIENSIKETLKDECNFIQFNMDTKRNKDEKYKIKIALEAKKLIDKTKPDIVITSDDNAAKYLIKEHYNNSSIPFVFCGINWTVKEYGFPYSNVTGMIEVTPIRQLFELAQKTTKAKMALFIGDDTITDKKDLARFKSDAKLLNIKLDSTLVNTTKEWKNAYLLGQDKYDFIILGHNAAIKDWNDEDINKFVKDNTKVLSMTTYSWMMKFSTFGLTILPSEQGYWAAKTALAILGGYPIKDISITTNKKWDVWVNMSILNSANIKIPRKILNRSKRIKN